MRVECQADQSYFNTDPKLMTQINERFWHPQLSNPTEPLAQQWVYDLSFPAGRLAYVPSYLESSPMVALAAQAVLAATRNLLCRGQAGDDLSRRMYLHAIQLLRDGLDGSDASLLTVGLLSRYEQWALNPHAHGSHMTGITALLLTQSEASTPSPVAGAFLYMSKVNRCYGPVWLGLHSSFANNAWLDMDLVCTAGGCFAEARRLRRISNQLYIQLPTLISCVRRILDTGNCQTLATLANLVHGSLELAMRLSQLEDEAAESRVLHELSVKPTADPYVRKFLPYSLHFNSNEVLVAAADYWEARLLTTNICLALLKTTEVNLVLDESHHTLPDIGKLRRDRQRLVKNIFMSWSSFFTDADNRMVMLSVFMPF